MSPEALAYSPTFNRSQVVLGGDNETILKRVAGPQIVPVYGNDFRPADENGRASGRAMSGRYSG